MSTNQASITEKYFPHVYWYNWAKDSFEQAKTTTEGRFYNSMIPMIFSAFCIEAYLNLLGKILIHRWAQLERRSHKEKLNKIAKQLQFSPDFSSPPFQSYDEIFGFRNLIAHAKPDEFSKIEKLCDLDHAERFLSDTESMVGQLQKIFIEYIERNEDKYGEDFFEREGIPKENPFSFMKWSNSNE